METTSDSKPHNITDDTIKNVASIGSVEIKSQQNLYLQSIPIKISEASI